MGCIRAAVRPFDSRWFDPLVGRFMQADTIVPQPGNPQALNRYSYVLGNPLRYTDPTGMFSEEEIMKYYGVKTWDEVLAMFGKGGKLEGHWGWLETLRNARLGDMVTFAIDARVSGDGIGSNIAFSGTFSENEKGQLVLLDADNRVYDPVSVASEKQVEVFNLYRHDPTDLRGPNFPNWIGQWQADRQYLHQKIDDGLYDLITLEHLAEAAGATTSLVVLTVGFAALAVELCTTGIGCLGSVALAPAIPASATATYYMGVGTWELMRHHWDENVWYTP